MQVFQSYGKLFQHFAQHAKEGQKGFASGEKRLSSYYYYNCYYSCHQHRHHHQHHHHNHLHHNHHRLNLKAKIGNREAVAGVGKLGLEALSLDHNNKLSLSL